MTPRLWTMPMKNALAALAILIASAIPCLAEPGIDQAVADYNARRYKEALAKLQDLSRQGKATDTAHYYMGLCYQSLNQIASAKAQYQWLAQNSRDQMIRGRAAEALASVERWSLNRAYSGQGNDFNRSGGGKLAPIILKTGAS